MAVDDDRPVEGVESLPELMTAPDRAKPWRPQVVNEKERNG